MHQLCLSRQPLPGHKSALFNRQADLIEKLSVLGFSSVAGRHIASMGSINV